MSDLDLIRRVQALEKRVAWLESKHLPLGPTPCGDEVAYACADPYQKLSKDSLCGKCGVRLDPEKPYACQDPSCPGKVKCAGGQRW